MTRPIALVLGLIMCAAVGAICRPGWGGGDPGPSQAGGRLTVEETLGLTFTRFFDTPFTPFAARANPGAVVALRRTLDDKDLRPYHSQAWLILGYIGDATDVARISKAINNYSGVLSIEDRHTIWSMFDALGVMCRRDINGASELLGDMKDPSYWREAKFRMFDKPMPQRPIFEYELIIQVMEGYSLSMKPDLEGQAQLILDGISDLEQRHMMAAAISPIRLTEHQKRAIEEEASLPEPRIAGKLSSQFNGDLEHPGPAVKKSPNDQKNATNKVGASVRSSQQFSGDEEKMLTVDALGAYRQISDALLRGDAEYTVTHILDDGKPLGSRDQILRAESLNDLQRTKTFLGKVHASETRPGVTRIERRPEVGPDGKEVVVILVTQELLGTEALGSSIRSKRGSIATAAKGGNLIVVMKKIDGRWYWNPFGW